MATINEILDETEDNIRSKNLPGTITRVNDANLRDKVTMELRDRGILRLPSTAELLTASKDNTKIVLVISKGLFVITSTPDSADNITTFASANAGWLWVLICDFQASGLKDQFAIAEDDSYTIEAGFMIDKILIKPVGIITAKVGLTNGGEEIMEANVLPANKWYSINRDIMTTNTDINIYFTGITAGTTVIIYKRII